MTFKTTEFDLTDDFPKSTGCEETYIADSYERAIESFVYTRKLSSGNFTHKIGPSGRVLYSGNKAWVFTKETNE
jgi:hypothetical protein